MKEQGPTGGQEIGKLTIKPNPNRLEGRGIIMAEGMEQVAQIGARQSYQRKQHNQERQR